MPTTNAAAPAGAADPASRPATGDAPPRLLRIHEVAELVGLTTRSIRYYEEVGLLKPAGRTECDYRQYDADDLERLRFIKAMRDDAGFTLAEIGRLLEDEQARHRQRERFLATQDPAERREILVASAARLDGQLASLREKAGRLQAMIAGVEERRARVDGRLAELDLVEGAGTPAASAVPPTSLAAAPGMGPSDAAGPLTRRAGGAR
jgi:MerR family copper efflux transcriptional regulator